MNLDPLAILNALPEAALLRDADGVVRHVNPAAERLLDVRAAEVVGGSDLPGISDEQLSRGETNFEICGLDRPTMVQIVPVEGGGSLVVYRDNSWQQQAHKYYQTLAFDLLAPLNSVYHAVNLIKKMRVAMTDEQQEEILAMASRTSLGLQGEMLFLRDQIRYETFDRSLCITEVALPESIRQTLEPLQQAYDFAEVQVDTDRDLPLVSCDLRRMLFVLRALFRHAINLQARQLHITFLSEDQYLAMKCTISHTSDSYRHNFAYRDLCQRLLEQQSGTFEFTVSSETTQTCRITLPIASEPPAA